MKNDDWLRQATPDIEARMAAYEEGQVEFAILGLVKEPLLNLIPSLAENIKALSVTTQRLDEIMPDWRDFVTDGTDAEPYYHINGPDAAYNLDQASIDRAALSSATREKIDGEAISPLMTYRQQLITDQASLRASIKEEQQSIQMDQQRAMDRRQDPGRVVQELLRRLASKKIFGPSSKETPDP